MTPPDTSMGKHKGWWSSRHDNDDGDIEYHAYGPKDSFVVFEGPNAKQNCEIFMKAVGGLLPV